MQFHQQCCICEVLQQLSSPLRTALGIYSTRAINVLHVPNRNHHGGDISIIIIKSQKDDQGLIDRAHIETVKWTGKWSHVNKNNEDKITCTPILSMHIVLSQIPVDVWEMGYAWFSGLYIVKDVVPGVSAGCLGTSPWRQDSRQSLHPVVFTLKEERYNMLINNFERSW